MKHGDLDVELTEETGEEQAQRLADQGNELGQRRTGLFFTKIMIFHGFFGKTI